MTRHPTDPIPLDGGLDPERFERMVAAITAQAAPELARRARPATPLLLLEGWARPAMAAAVSLTAAAMLALSLVRPAEAEPGPVASGLGLETTAAAWVETGQSPELETLMISQENTP